MSSTAQEESVKKECSRTLTPIRKPFFLPALALLVSLAGLSTPVQADTETEQSCREAVRPKVLLLIDNSAATQASPVPGGIPYQPTQIYQSSVFKPHSIYAQNSRGEFTPKGEVLANYKPLLENLTCRTNNDLIRKSILLNGIYVARGTFAEPNLKNGTCDYGSKGEVYALGRYLSYLHVLPPVSPHGTQPYVFQSAREWIFDFAEKIVTTARQDVDFGVMVFGHNNKGGEIIIPVGDLRGDQALEAFLRRLPGSGSPEAEPVLKNPNTLPLAEALVDAGAYFRGEPLPISGQSAIASPITAPETSIHVLILAAGLPRGENIPLLETLVGDRDGDGGDDVYGQGTHYLDDVAKALYETDAAPNLEGQQRISTSVIYLGGEFDSLMQRTADLNHGRGMFLNRFYPLEFVKALPQPLCSE